MKLIRFFLPLACSFALASACSSPPLDAPGGSGEKTTDTTDGTTTSSSETSGGSDNTSGSSDDTSGTSAGGSIETGAGGANSTASGGDSSTTFVPTEGSGGTSQANDLPGPDCPAPIDLGVRIVGRHDGCTEDAVTLSWSGTGFVARLEGTQLSMTIEAAALHFTVIVDGQTQPTLVTEGGVETVELVSNLEPGAHDIEVYRQGEASFGPLLLRGVHSEGGTLLEPAPRPERSIEIFGDSISCGYGNEGTTASCSFSAETENHYLTYGALLARHFGAELSTVAWSGKGVVVNYGGDRSITLPDMMERANPASEQSVWDFASVPAPDVVIINLGTNDFSTDNDPSNEEFVSVYAQMLERLRKRYGSSLIVGTVGPLLGGTDLDLARSGIEAAVAQRTAAGDERVLAFDLENSNPDPGCDWHPGVQAHQLMANQLALLLGEQLGW